MRVLRSMWSVEVHTQQSTLVQTPTCTKRRPASTSCATNHTTEPKTRCTHSTTCTWWVITDDHTPPLPPQSSVPAQQTGVDPSSQQHVPILCSSPTYQQAWPRKTVPFLARDEWSQSVIRLLNEILRSERAWLAAGKLRSVPGSIVFAGPIFHRHSSIPRQSPPQTRTPLALTCRRRFQRPRWIAWCTTLHVLR